LLLIFLVLDIEGLSGDANNPGDPRVRISLLSKVVYEVLGGAFVKVSPFMKKSSEGCSRFFV
jgi:hypothetical protein